MSDPSGPGPAVRRRLLLAVACLLLIAGCVRVESTAEARPTQVAQAQGGAAKAEPSGSATVHVRWAQNVTPETRAQLEKTYSLNDPQLREGTTWRYRLSDVSTANVRALVNDPSVEDTAYIDRDAFKVTP
jgi:hypothetical protein